MLVGRRQAQRDLEALLAGARLGQSGVVVVRGEAGIGKSALLDDAVDRSSGLRLLRVTGSEAERELPFAGLATLLRPLLDRVDTLPAPQAEALGVALALREGRSADRFAIAAGLLTLLTGASEERPTAVVVDDAHLLDRPSAEALAFVARRLVADALLVVLAVRPDETASYDGLPTLDLARLDPEVARELVRAADAALTEEQVARIVELGAGNPLVLRTLAGQPESLGDLAPGLAQVAATAFGMRLERLDAGALEVLRVAAVAGEDLAIVGRACVALGVSPDDLGAAEDSGLLVTDADRLAFLHPLARTAVYAGMPAGTRRELHALVADVLPPGDEDRRAWHLSAATLGPDASVAAALDAVAARATARGAHAVASSASERAAQLSPAPEDVGRRLLTAGESAWLSGEDERAAAVLDEALRHLVAPGPRARVRAVTGLAAARSGRLGEAYTQLLRAADRAGPDAVGEALALYAEVVEVCCYLLDVPAAAVVAQRLERMLADPEVCARAGTRAEAIASVAVGMARTLEGDAGVEHLRRGVALFAGLPLADHRSRSAWEVLGPLYLRESGAGRELVDRAVTERREAGAIGELPHLLFHLARDDATGERWTRGEAGYGEAIVLAREAGQATELAANLAGLCWLHARQGRADDCRAAGAEARTVADEHDVHLAAAWVDFGLAELALSLGEVADAAAGFHSLATWLADRDVGDPDLSPVPELVETRLRLGDDPRDDPLVSSYLTRAERKGRPWSLARAARVRAMLCPDEEVDAAFGAALAEHLRTPDRFETARTRLLYGERLRRLRRRADAREHLRAALDDFDRLGARSWSDVATAELDATGLTLRRRETGPVVELTARELQIALLLAEGQTTRQAAAALFLSPKTVEYHLRHVYTKLGIGSRAELAERMAGG
ncbi:helix-turn-helix transcriptional regulator [Nocardioides mangrovi]|uniref:AAA family ATPase n=1 Tax=Nocardioides mangrovi TaxID=2874580 RepID=A0ABS7UFM1_9ACTN|nr:helix-turn-helix transcriptional regulator [Nocardioides mangrovi]MBZ5739491.1 AAA family ATPase [Nocardioides mangrovi]